jgi:anti-repressor protein
MENTATYDFQGHPVRVIKVQDKPWFVVVDICAAIDIAQAPAAVKRLHPDDCTTNTVIDSMGRKQEAHCVNESGMYDLVFQSRKPAAKDFRRFVTNEVLPQIRQTGVYVPDVDLPTALRKLADALQEKDEASARAIQAEDRIRQLNPIVAEWQTYMNSAGTVDFGALSQALGGGRTRFISRLRELKVLVSVEASQGGIRPMQQYAESGWFKVKMENTQVGPKYATYATPKGVSAVLNLLVKHGVGEHRWGALPTEEDLFAQLRFEEDAAAQPATASTPPSVDAGTFLRSLVKQPGQIAPSSPRT